MLFHIFISVILYMIDKIYEWPKHVFNHLIASRGAEGRNVT